MKPYARFQGNVATHGRRVTIKEAIENFQEMTEARIVDLASLRVKDNKGGHGKTC
jgi:hypothetical protein